MEEKLVDNVEYKETEIGLIPEDWEVVRLENIAKISAGGPAPQGSKYFNGKHPFIRVQHISNESHKLVGYDLITDDAIDKYNLKKYPKGTIIFPKSGASIYLEKRAILPFEAYIVSHICAVNVKNNNLVNNRYLYYILIDKKLSKKKANNYPTLNLSEVKAIKIPLPPLEEQKKIAYVLSTIQEAKEKTEQVIEATKALKKSLMKHLFTYGPVPLDEVDKVKLKETEIGVLRKEWKLVELGEVASKRSEKVDPKNEKAIYIGLEHIIPGKIKLEKFGYSKEVKSTKLKFYNGDILYAKLRPYLDKGALAEFEGICSTDIIVINPKRDIINPKYLAYLVHSSFFLEYATRSMTGVNHPRTNWSSLKKFKIPFPSLEEQKKIADILSTIDKKIEAEENKKKALEELFKSMLHNLMTGKIRVKDLGVG